MVLEKHFKTLKINKDIINRKADFILIKGKKVLNIEVNFYDGQGSKPEEIINSYKSRALDLKESNIEFMLITDGECWNNAKKSQLIVGFDNFTILNSYMCIDKYLEIYLKEYFD